MKKSLPYISLMLIFLCFLTLCGCQPKDAPIKAETELAFPGTLWNMTPEELTRALNLKDGAYQMQEEPFDPEQDDPTGMVSIGIETLTVFGAEGRVGFRFCDYIGDGQYGLNYIVVEYPQGTDLPAVKEAMVSSYGEPGYTYGSHVSGWKSETTPFDVLSQSQLQAIPEGSIELLKERNLSTVYLTDGQELENMNFYLPPVHGIVFTNTLGHTLTWNPPAE